MIKIVLAFLMLSGLLYADRDGGPYIGIGYGNSEYKSGGLYDSIKEEKAKLQYFYGGAYINKHLSVEMGYAKMQDGGFNIDDSIKLDYTLYNVSTLAHYAFFNDVWDFYAKFGAGQAKVNGEDGFSLIYGIGTSIRFSELFSVKLAYDIYEFGYDEEESDGTHDSASDYKQRIYYPYIALEFQF